MMHEGVLYYLSNPDNDPPPPPFSLYAPIHFRTLLIKQYHDENGHFGVDKKIRPPMKTTEVPPYPWDLDLSGPFPLSLSGNKYIASLYLKGNQTI